MLRARLEEAIQAHIDERGASTLGDLLGRDRGTIRRRGGDASEWPLDEGLLLAVYDQLVKEALLAFLQGDDRPTGEEVAINSDLVEELADTAEVQQRIAELLRGGRMRADVAAQVLGAIKARREHEDKHLIPDLEALCRRSP